MGKGGRYMIRRYVSGSVVEESKFWVPENVKARSKKKAGTLPRKQDQNDRDAIKQLARLINCNFAHGDLWITLRYSNDGLESVAGDEALTTDKLEDTKSATEKEVRLFLARMKREFKKAGKELSYILVTSDMDGQSGELVRPHHHIIMPRCDFETVSRQWKHGSVDYQILRDQPDYTPLAVYMLKQVRRKPNAKKYTPSRNLKKPIITEWVVAGCGALKAPLDSQLLASGEYDMYKGSHYIRYRAPKKEKRQRRTNLEGAGVV